MMIQAFKVEGLKFNTEREAIVVAKRIFMRYDKTRTINVIAISADGEEFVWDTYHAEHEPEVGDNNTIEMF